ncbi:kinesin-like protein KIN-UA isoform X2 [Elaeis guineensis]|uniref:Kinesin-like protein n=1 Tax=Elaeis guineensis var. tenera TaxID=51953 RepID=A0A8N4EWL6_ELAGV|nr:kinesin-like protein KIN-UA isoform X2 [Elaeis guineensis]
MASTNYHRASLRSERQIPTARGSVANASVRTKPASSKRSVAAGSLRASIDDENADSGRVRVAVRLRPKNAEDFPFDADFTDCVELQPELNRLKLRKNNWSSESYKFDEVFTESASQRRVYEAVAKPVVESILEGYNGTVMAYGQTGTGKTYTVGRLGKDDPSERGIMVRALEDIIANTNSNFDSVAVSYLQLYLESVQDLLAPEKTNIPIVEDPKTGEVSLPGASLVEIRDLDHSLELLQIGEANRYAANTKLNTESSRSHAILVVHVRRSLKKKEENDASSLASALNGDLPSFSMPIVQKSKLLVVDLAGSERIDKSGSEGHMLEEAKFINLSLTSLGKCINALAENGPHIPTRDSKLTRLLRDSFGGTARTSLIITIGPSARHYSETASTIMFGQRAMKIVNTIKLKEEVDYESLCRRLEYQIDYLTSDMDRQQKLRDTEKEQMEKKLKAYEVSLTDAEKKLVVKSEDFEKEKIHLELKIKSLLEELNTQKGENNHLFEEVVRLETCLKQSKHQLENSTYQKILADTTQMYEKKITELLKHLEDKNSHYSTLEAQMTEMQQQLNDNQKLLQIKEKVIDELQQEMSKLNKEAESKIQSLEAQKNELLLRKESLNKELKALQEKLLYEEMQRRTLEDDIVKSKNALNDHSTELEYKRSHQMDSSIRSASVLGGALNTPKPNKSRETISTQRDTISKIFEEVGLSNIVGLLKSEDLDVQIHAVKMIANLAAEDMNQEKIVEEGGLDALLTLLESSENTSIHRVTAGALANLAMNGLNQDLIMSKGGARLLAHIASRTDDPQTLRMVAGAIANLCGNEKLRMMLKEDGGIKALLGMVRSGNNDVIAQIARGMANFAKCESRGIKQGYKRGRSLLIEDGALNWMISSSTTFSAPIRRHIELALCHLAQNVSAEDNARDFVSNGGVKELVRISQESSREDMRNLASKALNSNPTFLAETRGV